MGRIIAENKHTGKLYPVDSKAIYRVIYEVVDVLPTENIKTSVIYCIPIVRKENEYDMFLYIDSDWVSVGSGSIDLSDYYTKEETAELLSDKMDLAPLNPTAQEIEAMPSGQVFIPNDSDIAVGVKTAAAGTAGDKQTYTTQYVDTYFAKTKFSNATPQRISSNLLPYRLWCNTLDGSLFFLKSQEYDSTQEEYICNWQPVACNVTVSSEDPPSSLRPSVEYDIVLPRYQKGSLWIKTVGASSLSSKLVSIYYCASWTTVYSGGMMISWYFNWVDITQNFYTKAEINTALSAKENTSNKVTSLSAQSTDTQYPSAKCVYDMIGDVETLLSQV